MLCQPLARPSAMSQDALNCEKGNRVPFLLPPTSYRIDTETLSQPSAVFDKPQPNKLHAFLDCNVFTYMRLINFCASVSVTRMYIYMCVCTPHTCLVGTEIRGWHEIPYNWSHTWL